MLADQIRRAIPATPKAKLCDLSAALWKAYGAGLVPEDEAQALAEAIQARKAIPAVPPQPRRVGSRPRAPESLERRRSWAASSWLPPTLAARFTQGEAAALGVVLSTIALSGSCDLCHGAVAGRAGVSVSTVKRALSEARRLGLIALQERRLSWCRNLPNVVTVLSPELRTWVATRGRGLRAAKGEWGGVQLGPGKESIDRLSDARPASTARNRGNREREGWRSTGKLGTTPHRLTSPSYAGRA